MSSPNEDEYAGLCADHTQKMVKKGACLLMPCVDGSAAGDMAFDAAVALRRKWDEIAVFHAYKGSCQNAVPHAFRQKELFEKYEVSLIGQIPSDRFSLIWEDRLDASAIGCLSTTLWRGRGSNTQPSRFPNGELPDFIILGSHGNKGPKSSPTIIGSNADLALRTLHAPCIIIKSPITRASHSYLFFVTSTEVSKHGLDMLMRLLQPRDTLELVHVISADDDVSDFKDITTYYEEEIEAAGPANSSFTLHIKERGLPVTKVITEFTHEREPDFLCVAPRATHKLSSVTDYVVNHTRCNIMLLKN